MRAVPRWHDAAGRTFASPDFAPAACVCEAGNPVAARDGASDARCFHLRPRSNRFERAPFSNGSLEFILMSQPNDAPAATVPVPRGPLPQVPAEMRLREITVEIDGKPVTAREGSTILDVARSIGIETPTLCYLENLTPVNVCRVCVVELEGSRVLVPACSRKIEPGMKIKTNSERVRTSRKLVLEFLASSVDLSTA